jgi:hypothetical protein
MNGSYSLFENAKRYIYCISSLIFRSFQFFYNQNWIALLFLFLFYREVVLSRFVFRRYPFLFGNFSHIFSNIFSLFRSFSMPFGWTSVATQIIAFKNLFQWKDRFFIIIFNQFIALIWFSMNIKRKFVPVSMYLLRTWRSIT